MTYSIGRTNIYLSAVMIRPRKQVRVELYLTGNKAKPCFYLLREQKDAIEKELGYALEWEELPAGQDSRIFFALNDADPEMKVDWPRQHQWLAKHLNDFHRVFAQRVRSLNPNEWKQETPLGRDRVTT